MKKGALVIFLSLVFSYSYAQLKNSIKINPKKDDKKMLELYKKLEQFKGSNVPGITKINPQMPALKPGLNKKLIRTNSNGDQVFVITPYNMPCISPGENFKSNMPIVPMKPIEAIKPNPDKAIKPTEE